MIWNDGIYADKKFATRQKIPSFDFMLGIASTSGGVKLNLIYYF